MTPNPGPNRLLVIALALIIGMPLAVRADECPGAVAWQQAHREQSADAVIARDRMRSIGDPALLASLKQRVGIDQDARLHWLANPDDRRSAARVLAVDRDNVAWLKQQVHAHGFPNVDQVGETGIHFAWLLLQHADRDPGFQRDQLPALEQSHADGGLSPGDLSRLTDRVLKNQGEPQRYGTQFDWFTGDFDLSDQHRVDSIDANRRALGVMPLRDYACMMSQEARAAKKRNLVD